MSESELEETCIHCDHPFDETYLRWHATRAIHKKDGVAVLRCRECGLSMPVRFQVVQA